MTVSSGCALMLSQTQALGRAICHAFPPCPPLFSVDVSLQPGDVGALMLLYGTLHAKRGGYGHGRGQG